MYFSNLNFLNLPRNAEEEIEEKRSIYDNPDLDLDTKRTNFYQVSISSTFYLQFFSYERHFGSFFYVHVTREKLPKQCSYKKHAHIMLMKLTADYCFSFLNVYYRRNRKKETILVFNSLELSAPGPPPNVHFC